MNNTILTKLKKILNEQMGYELVDLGANTNNTFRPICINQKGEKVKDVSILYNDKSGRIYVYDFAEQIIQNISFEIDGDEQIKKQWTSEEKGKFREELERYKKEQTEKFNKDFKSITDSGKKTYEQHNIN